MDINANAMRSEARVKARLRTYAERKLGSFMLKTQPKQKT